MHLNHLNLCNFDVLCKWHISTSPKLLNLIELICGDHAVLIPTALWTHLKMPAGRSVLFPQVPRAFHNGSVSWIILAFLSSPSCIQRGGENGWDFAQDQIGPETWISAPKTCDMSRKSSIPHWYLLRFCSVQIESLTLDYSHWSFSMLLQFWNHLMWSTSKHHNGRCPSETPAFEVGTFMDPKMHQRYFAEISINKDMATKRGNKLQNETPQVLRWWQWYQWLYMAVM